MKIEDCPSHDDVVALRKLEDLAYDLVSNFEDMKDTLVATRIKKKLTQQQVADRLGCSLQQVKDIEHYDANPTLGDIRRYALAVGARVEIKVTSDETI